ncbi:MAG TPA: alpha/beta hydrolase [Acidimicrobiia bacterium]|nr:alpha/beta hydrolase [Acidimicrobiia bacterium]
MSDNVGYSSVPETVSPDWADYFESLPDPADLPQLPPPDDFESWRERNRVLEAERLAAGFGDPGPGIEVLEAEIGGIPVLDIRPEGWVEDGRALLYTHGGVHVAFTARSTIGNAARVVRASGLRVVSVDYTIAPFARWQEITDQVIAVFQGLVAEGSSYGQLAIYGDSAGGSLAAGSVLKMRDLGLGTPAAVVMWSPWSDITDTGDTYQTLDGVDGSYLYDLHLMPAAAAYADPLDQKGPYVSPVYGDYSKGFPPTLIQGGTREIFLSNFIRHYQAIDAGGAEVKLDLYEGMPHSFQNKMTESPEARLAVTKTVDWVLSRLGSGSPA